MKTLYLDCWCGISGDMTVAALLDAGADLNVLEKAVADLHLEGVSVSAEKVDKRGIQATQFHVRVAPEAPQPHRHLPDIIRIIDAAPLPDSVKAKAVNCFELLGAAEAEVHGVPVEKVHFHEVGAADSIVDIVAANLALHLLGVERVIASRLVVGSGTVVCDHGVMPVPAPATALLLRGIPWESGDVAREMVTPTGAALVKCWASEYGTVPVMTSHAVGCGAGTRTLPDRANVLRVFLGETESAPPATETIWVLETVIDDMNPELTALLIPAALQAGARDAFITPVTAKKGRCAHCLTVLCDVAEIGAVGQAIFKHSGTLGLRMRQERRWILDRDVKHVKTPWGVVAVKVGLMDGSTHCVAPEFECCRALAEQQAVATRRVYESALAAAIQGEFIDEGANRLICR